MDALFVDDSLDAILQDSIPVPVKPAVQLGQQGKSAREKRAAASKTPKTVVAVKPQKALKTATESGETANNWSIKGCGAQGQGIGKTKSSNN